MSADEQFMSAALELAQQARDGGEVPVGAVAVREGHIIGSGRNSPIGSRDPTAHAEMLALRAAAASAKSPRLTDCDLYVTLEPCPMCAAAISFARVRRLYFGAEDAKGGGVVHGARVFAQPTCHHKPEVMGGIGDAEAATLLKDFFKERR